MRSIILYVIFVITAIANTTYAGFEEIINATCSVNRASGVLFGEDENYVWIITAAHCVVDENNQLEDTYVVFYNTGSPSGRMKAEVLWHVYQEGTTVDLAVIKVNKKLFNNYPIPKPVPLAPENTQTRPGDVVVSCGCPVKNYLDRPWPTAWRGKISTVNNKTFKFVPTPLPGRSGSGIFNKEGTYLLGIILLADGTTVPLKKIYELTGWQSK